MYVNRKLLSAITSAEPVDGLTHGFYRYPARFSPLFVRAVIEEFSNVGDIVLDPFMGSGTTMVEACALGRSGVGCDVNTLGVFLSKIKTTRFSASDISDVRIWARHLPCNIGLSFPVDATIPCINGMQRTDTWRLRKTIQQCLDSLTKLKSEKAKDLARCVILRTAQWALDCRSVLPSISQFKQQLLVTSDEVLRGARNFHEQVQRHRAQGVSTSVACIHCSAAELRFQSIWRRISPPTLVLTSPPYPGVHVLYHRWQIRGRRETPAPYWITGTMDGNGASFYTFGDRHQKDLSSYFRSVHECFSSIAAICDGRSLIVQMVAFSDRHNQLPRYLNAMREAGLKEVNIRSHVHGPGQRIWRKVPNRKWYAEQKTGVASASELVLFHRKA